MLKRIITGAVAAALLGVTPVALVTAPAQAAEDAWQSADARATTLPSRVVRTTAFQKRYRFNDRISASYRLEVYDPSGGCSHAADGWCSPPTYMGNQQLILERRFNGSSTWQTLATNNGNSLYYSGQWKGNAEYRARFPGGSNSHYDLTYPSATESSGLLRGFRLTSISDPFANRKADVRLKVKPAYKRKVVVLQRKQGKRWVTVRKARTNRKSVVTFRDLAAPAKFRLVVRGNKKFLKTKHAFSTVRY
ncbi:hypothetical protein [Nocardioides limicola]|uniref:hypothetical protein n=1 Tax=Nocardioides limicola TaxID=2803368 RepID=UPI00193B14CE|nr:hypothetical protein [Nocardioides sp. DJM-14]